MEPALTNGSERIPFLTQAGKSEPAKTTELGLTLMPCHLSPLADRGNLKAEEGWLRAITARAQRSKHGSQK